VLLAATSNLMKPLMKSPVVTFVLKLFLRSSTPDGNIPDGYKGRPFRDATHTSGPQTIQGRLEAALFGLGGEGIV
jgi:hypothetical protein